MIILVFHSRAACANLDLTRVREEAKGQINCMDDQLSG